MQGSRKDAYLGLLIVTVVLLLISSSFGWIIGHYCTYAVLVIASILCFIAVIAMIASAQVRDIFDRLALIMFYVVVAVFSGTMWITFEIETDPVFFWSYVHGAIGLVIR